MMKIVLACLFLILPIKARAQELPDVNQLIEDVIFRARFNDSIKKSFLQFTKEETVLNLNVKTGEKPKINESKTERRGAGLTNDETKLDLQDISHRFHEFKYVVPHILIDPHGRKYYMIHFKPKAVHQKGSNHYATAANRCSGTIYIDAERLYVYKLEGEMPESESFSAYLFGSIKWVHIEINQSFRPDLKDLVVIDSIIAKVKYRIQTVIFGARHYFEEYRYIYSDYKYISPAAVRD